MQAQVLNQGYAAYLDAQGRWKLEHAFTGKVWADIERRGQPSKWITLRALRVIKAVEETAVNA